MLFPPHTGCPGLPLQTPSALAVADSAPGVILFIDRLPFWARLSYTYDEENRNGKVFVAVVRAGGRGTRRPHAVELAGGWKDRDLEVEDL